MGYINDMLEYMAMHPQVDFIDEQTAAREVRKQSRRASRKQDPNGAQPKGIAPDPIVKADPPKPKPKILEW